MARTRVRMAGMALPMAVVASLSLLASSAAAGGAQGATQAERLVRYTVRPGDTLWTIAERVAGPGADLRPVVHQLVQRNGLTGGVIMPGQSIMVPPAGA